MDIFYKILFCISLDYFTMEAKIFKSGIPKAKTNIEAAMASGIPETKTVVITRPKTAELATSFACAYCWANKR